MQYQPHILFVEDDPDTCELIHFALSQGAFVCPNEGPVKGLGAVASNRFRCRVAG